MFKQIHTFVKSLFEPTKDLYVPSKITELPQYLKDHLRDDEIDLPVAWGTYYGVNGQRKTRSVEIINSQLYRTQMRYDREIIARHQRRGDDVKRIDKT